MNATLIASILASGLSGATLLGLYDRFRNRKFDQTKQQAAIKLDEATYTEIATRAAAVNDTNLMAVGAFWQGQFGEVAKKVADLEDWRRRAKGRLRAHERWDEMVAEKLEACGEHVDPPPKLDPDDHDD